MLYLVTTPPPLHPGTYRCEEISAEGAAILIKAASESNTLKPYVNFGSTRFAIQQLCGIKVELVRKIAIPTPADGDVFLDVRLKADSAGGQVGVEDLEFFKIWFQNQN